MKSKGVWTGLLFFVLFFMFSMLHSFMENGGVNGLALILCIVLAAGVYFIPGIVAKINNHTQKTAIILLNIFLGWTFIGWVVALVWAVIKEK